jgi:hypothetical protein
MCHFGLQNSAALRSSRGSVPGKSEGALWPRAISLVRLAAPQSRSLRNTSRTKGALNPRRERRGPSRYPIDLHAYDVPHPLERDAFPNLGAIPIEDITAGSVLAVIGKRSV